jgi:hypothetical protein
MLKTIICSIDLHILHITTLVNTNNKPKKQRDGESKSERNPKFKMEIGSDKRYAVAMQMPGRRMVKHLDTYIS